MKELPFDDGTRQVWLRHGGVCALGQRTESNSLTSQDVLMCVNVHRGPWWCVELCGEAVRHTEAQNFPQVWYNSLHTRNTRKGVGLGTKWLMSEYWSRMHGDPRNHLQDNSLVIFGYQIEAWRGFRPCHHHSVGTSNSKNEDQLFWLHTMCCVFLLNAYRAPCNLTVTSCLGKELFLFALFCFSLDR